MKEKKAVTALSALAQESRLAVFRLLMEQPEDSGLAAGDIATRLNVPATTMSFHLSQLKTAGLVDAVKQGRSIIYTANKKRAKKLCRFLMGKKTEEEEKYQL